VDSFLIGVVTVMRAEASALGKSPGPSLVAAGRGAWNGRPLCVDEPTRKSAA
jgi:hypothetical protein